MVFYGCEKIIQNSFEMNTSCLKLSSRNNCKPLFHKLFYAPTTSNKLILLTAGVEFGLPQC